MSGQFPSFLNEPVDSVAQRLLGCILERELGGKTVRVRIVETEAYDQSDEASHTFRGKTARNATMFGPAGHLYVYFTYGMHYCCNVVAGPAGYGAGALIRAVEPLDRLELFEQRRKATGVNITNGPAKLCQALGIDKAMNGHDLHKSPLKLITGALTPSEQIASSPRIGISRAKQAKRRYFIVGNRYVSH